MDWILDKDVDIEIAQKKYDDNHIVFICPYCSCISQTRQGIITHCKTHVYEPTYFQFIAKHMRRPAILQILQNCLYDGIIDSTIFNTCYNLI